MKALLLTLTVIFASLFLAETKLRNEAETKLEAYENYYQATEEVLDTLENRYNWVDTYDPENYYNSINKLNKHEI